MKKDITFEDIPDSLKIKLIELEHEIGKNVDAPKMGRKKASEILDMIEQEGGLLKFDSGQCYTDNDYFMNYKKDCWVKGVSMGLPPSDNPFHCSGGCFWRDQYTKGFFKEMGRNQVLNWIESRWRKYSSVLEYIKNPGSK